MDKDELGRYEIEGFSEGGKDSKPLKLRVTFPSGKVICYAIVEKTFIETLKEIGSERFPEIQIKIGQYPLVSKVKIAKYGESMKPVVDGWYVNTQSDTRQKYMQLIAIKKQLNLDVQIELGKDFTATRTQGDRNKRRVLKIKAISDDWQICEKPEDAYISVLKKIGLEALMSSSLRLDDMKLVTPTKQYPSQKMVDKYWVTFPRYNRYVLKWLRTIIAINKSEIQVWELDAGNDNDIFVNERMNAQVGDIIQYDSKLCSVISIRKALPREKLIVRYQDGSVTDLENDIDRYIVVIRF